MSDRLFYDGDCGLCHWAVSFVVPRDRHKTFRFAPLDSDAFRAAVPASVRSTLPDSMVVVTRDGRMLTRSSGVLYILTALGGAWKPLGVIGGLVPRPIRDWLYDRIAATRHRLFAKPATVCPIMPPALRDRFDA